MAEVIQDPQLRAFVNTKVSNDFGLSVAQVANKCKNDGRFKSWLGSDITKIKEVLETVKGNGVSPAFFASYEKTEGYNSSWGWLNHTVVNGGPVRDADSVSKWVATQSKVTNENPAWIDFANYNNFVPMSVQTAGNADFASMSSGTIGKVVIAGTAAGAWEVYYPLGLKKEYNGVQNYGAPINLMMNYIISWGGDLEGGSDGTGGGVPCYPVDEGIPISSSYGWRTNPVTGIYAFHDGTDFSGGGQSRPIYATQKGKVIKNEFNDIAGWHIRIEHIGDSYYSGYQHFAVRSPIAVGTIVEKCQLIGTMGTTGSSTGIHLHFQIAISENGWYTEEGTIDPEDYLGMDFGTGGGSGEDEQAKRKSNLIKLLLCDALNGWKY